jgi:allantoinase
MEPQRTGPFPFVPITKRPPLQWPNGSRVAVWVIPNIEFYPLDVPVPEGSGTVPDVPSYAARDYGARVGIWRVMDVMEGLGVPGTVALNSDVLDVYPGVVEAASELGWEIMGHNTQNSLWLNRIPAEKEQGVIRGVFDRIEEATGKRPVGWLGSGLHETWNTLEYLIAAGCRYVADWVNDDQPYVMEVGGKEIVSIPYTREINDLPLFLRQHRTAEEYETLVRRQFDTLYAEGTQSGRVMAIALHPFVIGVPHRIGALRSALQYIAGHEGVWFARGEEIIDGYLSAMRQQPKR